MKILFALFILGVITWTTFALGEFVSAKYPNTKLAKWWKRHIVDKYPWE